MGKAELLILTQPRNQSKHHFHASVQLQDYFLHMEGIFFLSRVVTARESGIPFLSKYNTNKGIKHQALARVCSVLSSGYKVGACHGVVQGRSFR